MKAQWVYSEVCLIPLRTAEQFSLCGVRSLAHVALCLKASVKYHSNGRAQGRGQTETNARAQAQGRAANKARTSRQAFNLCSTCSVQVPHPNHSSARDSVAAYEYQGR